MTFKLLQEEKPCIIPSFTGNSEHINRDSRKYNCNCWSKRRSKLSYLFVPLLAGQLTCVLWKKERHSFGSAKASVCSRELCP